MVTYRQINRRKSNLITYITGLQETMGQVRQLRIMCPLREEESGRGLGLKREGRQFTRR